MQAKLHLLLFEQQSAILLVHQNSLQDLFSTVRSKLKMT